MIDVNTRVFESEIFSGSDATSHGIPAVHDMNTTPPKCALPRLSYTNNSSKKNKLFDYFPTSIKKLYGWDNEGLSEPIYSER